MVKRARKRRSEMLEQVLPNRVFSEGLARNRHQPRIEGVGEDACGSELASGLRQREWAFRALRYMK